MNLDYKNKKLVSFELTENRAYKHADDTEKDLARSFKLIFRQDL